MAFFGIFVLSWIVIMFIAFIVAIILFVLIPCLIVSIINLVLCIKNKWQKKNLIPMIICGAILTYFLFAVAQTLIKYAITPKVSNGNVESALIAFFISIL